MRQLCLIIAGLLLLHIGIMTGAREWAIQRNHEPDYLALSVQGCEAPCWYGIEPGVSNMDDLEISLEQANRPGRWILSQNGTIDNDGTVRTFQLRIVGNAPVTLADVLLVYGKPEHVTMSYSTFIMSQSGQRKITTQGVLYWRQGYIQVRASLPGKLQQVRPDMQVQEIRFWQPYPEPLTPLGVFAWEGFKNVRAYMPKED